MKLSHSVSGAIRMFAYWVANGTVGMPMLEGIDYFDVMKEEPSSMELAFAVFINNLDIDENGKVLNARYAEERAAQCIKQYCVKEYTAEPPLEEFEMTLY